MEAWGEVWKAFEQAFTLMGSNDRIMNEIIATTMYMAFNSSLWSFLIGAPIGILLSSRNFLGKKIIVTFQRTLMGLPPVAVGIFMFLLFTGTGPFRKLNIIYSVELMILAQIVLLTPIVAGMTESALSPVSNRMRETVKGLRIGWGKSMFLTLNEGKYQFVAIYLFAFSRAIAEVGAVQIVGGNILHKTRVMTTAIALNYGMGEFSLALALGVILLIIALGANVAATVLQNLNKKND